MIFFSWVFYTVAIFAIVYLVIKLNYTKSLYQKELNVSAKQKEAIADAQLLIRKYRTQLQRSIGNIDILTEELNKVRNDVKSLRAKNSQTRLEKSQLTEKVKELEERIDALI
jgi:peptidoglycan hydrolase CwlO-like protein